jgi:stage III sporulation protein SpoIIIAA
LQAAKSDTGSALLPEQQITDNLDLLLEALPEHIRGRLASQPDLDQLLEVVLDLGHPPEAIFPVRTLHLGDHPVAHQDIEYVVQRIGEFGSDNRAGIARTLHRISAIRNRPGKIIGLTCRVGRSVTGTVDIIRDIVETGKSILLLGRPGIGKTTKLREVARVLADELGKRVVVVDTSNEIAGDGDIPHPGIGSSRRMQVRSPELQHAVMIEAVENHMPEVIVIDEIGTEAEAMAARTIAERGVQLVATAHGNNLDNLLMNPTLCDLVGGVHVVTLSDEEAYRRGTQKTVLERKASPTFQILVEIMEMDKLALHHDVAATVDHVLRGGAPSPEIRLKKPSGKVEIVPPQQVPQESEAVRGARVAGRPPAVLRIFPYGVSRGKIERAVKELDMKADISRSWEESDVILALRAYQRRDPEKLRQAQESGVPVHILRSNTHLQVLSGLRSLMSLADDALERLAIHQAEQGAQEALALEKPVELPPQRAYLRRLQHRVANRYNLSSESVGVEPYRRVRLSVRAAGDSGA